MRSTLPPIIHDAEPRRPARNLDPRLSEKQVVWQRQIEEYEWLWFLFRLRNKPVAQYTYAGEPVGHRPAAGKERDRARAALRCLRAWYPR